MKKKYGDDYFLLAHIDVEKAYFRQEKELGIDFVNEIDAWTKMEFKFRKRKNANTRNSKEDGESIIYGLRTAIEK